MPAFTFAFWRGAAVAITLALVVIAVGRAFPRGRSALGAVVLAGAIYHGISPALIFWSMQYVPSGLVALFGASAPVWGAVIAHFATTDDRLTLPKVIGLASGLVGIALLIQADIPVDGPGRLALLLLGLMPVLWAAAATLIRTKLQTESPIAVAAMQNAAGALVLLFFLPLDAGRPQDWNAQSGLAFTYLVVFGGCVGQVLFIWLLQRLRATTVLFVQLIIPAQAVLIGALLLGELVTVRLLMGGGLIAVGITLNAVPTQRVWRYVLGSASRAGTP